MKKKKEPKMYMRFSSSHGTYEQREQKIPFIPVSGGKVARAYCCELTGAYTVYRGDVPFWELYVVVGNDVTVPIETLYDVDAPLVFDSGHRLWSKKEAEAKGRAEALQALRLEMVEDHATWMALEYSEHVSAGVPIASRIAADKAKASAQTYAKALLLLRRAK